MNIDQRLKDVVVRNPKVRMKRVEAFLRYLASLEAAGIDTKARYGITHPFAGKPEAVRANWARSLNRMASGQKLLS